MAKYGKKAQSKVKRAMHERKRGTLKSGSGKTVKSKEQAIAIGLSEARKAGGKVPAKKKSSARKKSPARKAASRKKSSSTRSRKSTARKSSSRKKSTTAKKSSSSRSTAKRKAPKK